MGSLQSNAFLAGILGTLAEFDLTYPEVPGRTFLPFLPNLAKSKSAFISQTPVGFRV